MLKHRTSRNIISGLLYHCLSIAMGLVIPYLLIHELGSESNGLISSIGQLFVCLGLLEGGVRVVTIQALYKPVADSDKDSISSILSATNIYYRKSGLWFFLGILLLIVFYPILVHSALSDVTIRLVILFEGASILLGYFISKKYIYLLYAEGKNYIVTYITIVQLIVKNIGKIIAINLGYGIEIVESIQFFAAMLETIIVLLYMHHKYKWLNIKSVPDLVALSQKKSVMAQSIAWTVFNHTDMLVLTLITKNLALVSVYSVYLLIFETVQNLISSVRDSYQFKIGNIAQKRREDLSAFFVRYSTAISLMTNSLFIIAYLLSNAFIKLYTNNVKDIQYVVQGIPELFVLYKILYCTRYLDKQVIDGVGHFKQTQMIPIIETILNLSVSIILVPFLGIHGVLIGTIIALLYGTFSYMYYVGNVVLYGKFLLMFIQFWINIIPVIVAIFYNSIFPITSSGYVELIVKGIVTSLVVLLIFITMYICEKKVVISFCNRC